MHDICMYARMLFPPIISIYHGFIAKLGHNNCFNTSCNIHALKTVQRYGQLEGVTMEMEKLYSYMQLFA